jgi:uncharacterized protein
MTEQSKQLVAGMYEAFGRGDLEAVLSALAEDVDWNLPGVAPYAGVRRGRGAVRDFFTELIMAAKIEMFEVDAVIAEGARVVVLGRERCTTVKTGRTFEQHWAHAYTVRDGMVASAHLYEDTHAQALAFA